MMNVTSAEVQATTMGQQKVLPHVSVILVAFNSVHYLRNCLTSLLSQTYPDFDIVVVDNASTDGSAALVEKEFPQIRLIRLKINTGFGGGNNRGVLAATGEVLAFLNVDTQVEPNWLFPLVEVLDSDSSVGLVTAKILLLTEPTRANTCGNDVHFTGIGFLRGLGIPSEQLQQDQEVFGVSGAAFAIRRLLYEQLGGFDEGFFPAYAEDTDLSWRTRLLGYKCIYVHRSVIYHDYRTAFSVNKIYWLERNRYQLLLKNLRWRTVLLITPGLLLTECVTWGYAILSGVGHIGAKLRAYSWLIRNLTHVLQVRKNIQQTRRVDDRSIMRFCTHRLAYAQTGDSWIVRISEIILDPLFFVIHRTALALMHW